MKKQWTNKEVALLRLLYPSTSCRVDIFAEFPRRSRAAIRTKARDLGIKRGKKKKTEHFRDWVRIAEGYLELRRGVQ